MNETENPIGSIWHRWDPHIHLPGTLINDNYGKQCSLNDFIKKINASSPAIRALGITDYYVLDSYERILPFFKNGKLPNVKLLFANVELRFAVNAAKGSPINVHLLISPEDNDHIQKAKRFLRDLRFEYNGEDYCCINDDLIRLGNAFEPSSNDKNYLLKLGAEQFKVTPNDLSKAFKNHK